MQLILLITRDVSWKSGTNYFDLMFFIVKYVRHKQGFNCLKPVENLRSLLFSLKI